jgi:hypothetical protein
MSAAIFNSGTVKILKEKLRFQNSLVEIITNDTDDPSSVAKDAPQGSLYIRSGTDEIYIKQDAGSSTNWIRIADLNDASPAYTVNSISTNTNAAVNNTYLVDTSGGTVQVTLPSPSTSGTFVRVKSTGDARANNITVARNAAESIEGVAGNYTMNNDYEEIDFVSDGSDWWIL